MRSSILTAWTVTLAATTLIASCSRETIVDGGGEDVPVTLNLATRGISPDTDSEANKELDSEMASLRVLVYKSYSGQLMWNYYIDLEEAGNTPPHEIGVKTGTYDFIFIANEGTLATTLDDDTQIGTIAQLKALTLGRGAFDGEEENIPMVSWYPSVRVIEDRHVAFDDPFNGLPETVNNTVWKVKMQRAVLRLSMTVTLPEWRYIDWIGSKISIANIPDYIFLLPGRDNSSSQPVYTDFAASTTLGAAPGLITGPDAATGNYTVTYDRLILPELFFRPDTDESKALVLKIDFGDGEKTARIFAPASANFGYTLPRNTWLHLNATIHRIFEIKTGVLEWTLWQTAPNEPIVLE